MFRCEGSEGCGVRPKLKAFPIFQGFNDAQQITQCSSLLLNFEVMSTDSASALGPSRSNKIHI